MNSPMTSGTLPSRRLPGSGRASTGTRSGQAVSFPPFAWCRELDIAAQIGSTAGALPRFPFTQHHAVIDRPRGRSPCGPE